MIMFWFKCRFENLTVVWLKVKGRLAGSSALQLLVSLLCPTPNTVIVLSNISIGAIAPSGSRALC
jgi:hypothetical protein